MWYRSLALSLALLPAALAAQFDFTARLIDVRSGAHANAPGLGDAPTMRPSSALGGAVDLGLRRGAWRLAIGAARSSHDLIIIGSQAGVVTTGVLRATAVSASVGRPLFSHAGASLGWAVGIKGIRWSFPGLDEEPRWRWGPVASLDALMPLAGRVGLVTRLAASRAQGVFADLELPDGYQRTAANRIELSVGLRLGGE